MKLISDLEEAMTSAESLKATYLMVAQSTKDASEKRKYEEMATNIDSHILYLNSRLDNLNSSNTPNDPRLVNPI